MLTVHGGGGTYDILFNGEGTCEEEIENGIGAASKAIGAMRSEVLENKDESDQCNGTSYATVWVQNLDNTEGARETSIHPSPSLSRSSSTYAKTASLMFSRDSLVCHLATQRTLAEASAQRQAFKPFQQVIEMMQENPGASPWQHEQKAEWQRWIHQSVLSSVGPSQYRDRL